MFGREKTYSQKEVDELLNKHKKDCESTISLLRSQIAEMKQQLEAEEEKNKQHVINEDKIKEALIHAIDKAKNIETEGKKFYEAQLERVKLLYVKWSQTINDVREKYGIVNSEELNAQKFANEIENFLTATIDVQIKREPQKAAVSSDEKFYHKQLLTRMSGLMSSVSAKLKEENVPKPEIVVPLPKILERGETAPKPAEKSVKMHETQNISKEQKAPEQKPEKAAEKSQAYVQFEEETKRLNAQIPPKTIITERKTGGAYASVLEKYLKEDEEDVLSNTYAKKLSTAANYNPNESGFDLKEALNPRDSLEDILKEFNFDS